MCVGQDTATSLQDAERAFADALPRHDRAAFAAMFAPDVESWLRCSARCGALIEAAKNRN